MIPTDFYIISLELKGIVKLSLIYIDTQVSLKNLFICGVRLNNERKHMRNVLKLIKNTLP